MLALRKQVVFLIGLILFLLLLTLLGETYLGYLLLAAGGGLMVITSKNLRWSKVAQYSAVAGMWVLLLITVGVSSYYSINLPLSLYDASRYLWIFVWFWYWLLLDESLTTPAAVIQSLLMLGLSVVGVSLFFSVFNNLAELLPGMNLLHSIYGHNHIAALLLLLIPLSWWWVLSLPADDSRIALLVPGVLSLALLLSFGRVAVAIGFTQLILIWFLIRYRLKQGSERMVRSVLRVLIGLFVVVLLLKAFLSLVPFWQPEFACPAPALETQLCKFVQTEARPHYWQRAVEIIADNVWFGSGPGTYSIASRKYQLIPGVNSSYTHNAFLQELSELGLIGGAAFIGLMLLLVWRVAQVLGKEQSLDHFTWQQAAALSIVSLYLNALLDFDWDFVSIISITLLLAALVIRDYRGEGGISFRGVIKTWRRVSTPVIRLLFTTSLIVLVGLGGLYLLTELYISAGKPNRAFKVFPYFHWHRKIYEVGGNLSTQQDRQLQQLYRYHPDFYSSYLSRVNDPAQREQAQAQLLEIDPWQVQSFDLIRFYLNQNNWQRAAELVELQLELWRRAEQHSRYQARYQDKLELAEQMLELAKLTYQAGYPQQAAKYYLDAVKINIGIIDQQQAPLDLTTAPAERQIMFLAELSSIPGEYLGQYRNVYTQQYVSALSLIVESGNVDHVTTHAQNILHLANWMATDIWMQVGATMLSMVESELENQQPLAAKYVADELYQLWEILDVSSIDQGWELQHQLAVYQVEIGNQLFESEPELAVDSYYRAHQLVPWISGTTNLWFDYEEVSSLETEYLYRYFLAAQRLYDETISWYQQEHAELVLVLAERLVTEKKTVELVDLIHSISNWQRFDFQRRQVLREQILQLAAELVDEGQPSTAVELEEAATLLQ